MSFVHLHLHTEYSILDGFSNIKVLIDRAKELDMPAVALTDHGNMFGVVDFYKTATAAGIKPIIGMEAYLAARGMGDRDPQFDKKSSHLLLLAENESGYKNLLKIARASQFEGFYYHPRIDHEFLAQHSEGLICTSGCLSAEIPRAIKQGDSEGAWRKLDWYYEVFGPDNFFLELQQHDIKELQQVNKFLIDQKKRYQSKYIATNDVHYIDKEDARLQDILLTIQTGSVLSDPNRMRMTDNSYYLRSYQEMASLFSEIPEAISNTLRISERCNVELEFGKYKLPEFDVPEEYSVESYLRKLCERGLIDRYGNRSNDPVLRERLEYELEIINRMGFDAYFLIVWDLCRHAAERGIWYNARGSAAGSIVAYCLNITLVDPIDYGLIFERFLNPGRVNMPDIDLDFSDDRRTEMLEYTAQKYGDDKVAQVITFSTLGARAAIRDVGRVMDIPLNEVDRVSKKVPNVPGKEMGIKKALNKVSEFKELYESTPYLRELIDTAKEMEGVVRSVGTHAAGVIVSDKPITEYVPLHRPTGSSSADIPIKAVTQFEMANLDALGLLKVDFLGLSTLSIMAYASELIRKRHGVELTLENIPLDDPETYNLLGRGETAGVFQVESSGMRRYLVEMKPRELANVIAMVALFRPGPMDFIPGYIRRMHDEEDVTYIHPKLEPIFKETYGYPVYQEQLMFAAMNLAGYSAPEADNLRKAVAKKMKKKLLKHRKKFVTGAVENGIDKETADEIFSEWEKFARYGFNKAHAADYGVLAVQTAYLKAHYPVEYMTALLSVYQGNTDKVALYVADCQRMGISVEPPDVNKSDWGFCIEDHTDDSSSIRFGFGAVKNVGRGPVEAIINGRGDIEFKDITDFAHRVDLRKVGKRALESLIKVGALDCFDSRGVLLSALDQINAISNNHFRAAEAGQLSMFGEQTGIVEEIPLPKVPAQSSHREELNWEKDLLGLYVSDHPLNSVMDQITQAVTHFSGQLSEVEENEKVRVAGMIVHIRHHQSKAGNPMAFATLEDMQGSIDLVIFPSVWKNVSGLVEYDKIILVKGRVDNSRGDPKVLVDKITADLGEGKKTSYAPTEMVDKPADQNKTGHQVDNIDSYPQDESAAGSGIRESQQDGDKDESGETPSSTSPNASPSGWGQVEVKFNSLESVVKKIYDIDEWKSEVPVSEGNSLDKISQGEGSDDQIQPPVAEKIPGEQSESITPSLQNVDKSEDSENLESALPLPPYLVPPISKADSGEVRMVTIVLRSTGDKARDVLRIRRIHGIVNTYPGDDRIALHVFERDCGYLLEFPNLTSGICQELISRLANLVGSKNVRVETIPLH